MIWNAEDGQSQQFAKKHNLNDHYRKRGDENAYDVGNDREAVFVSELSLCNFQSRPSSSSSSDEFSFDVETIQETGKRENTKDAHPLFQKTERGNDGFTSSSSDDSLVTKKDPIQMIKRKERKAVSRKRSSPSESIFDSDEFDVIRWIETGT